MEKKKLIEMLPESYDRKHRAATGAGGLTYMKLNPLSQGYTSRDFLVN